MLFRSTFDEVAELYDSARPGYPDRVFEDLEELAVLGPGSRVLEIGPGTGQATYSLAKAGYEIIAVELGENLAAVAAQKLRAFPNVRVVLGPFEQWRNSDRPFDAVVSATAFYWLDPAIRMQKVADVLQPGGALALIDTVHIAGGTNEFFVAVQRCYERYDPDVPHGLRPPAVDEVPTANEELEASRLFGEVTLHRYVTEIGYSANEYIDLLRTYSAQRHLPNAARDGLYEDIRTLINDEFDGHIVKAYLTELRTARRP